MRPSNMSAHKDAVDIVATAPGGKLTLDGKAVDAAQPFPNVLHAVVKPLPGEHLLELSWPDGSRKVKFFVGPGAPAGYEAFKQHPPLAGVECTQCHGVSARGRFRFKGGCFDCHKQDGFAKSHTHPPAMLEQCGSCHNAHGSTVKAHLLQSKEASCKMCHE